jgi:ATP-dependent RNA helicase RhlE
LNSFEQLGLSAPLLKALADENYQTPTPIQAQAIPHVMAGRDLLGIAQTGTGKTAAFALPILYRLAADPKPAPRKGCRALILSPTRELATQIADSFKAYGRHLKLTTAVVFGGVSPHAQVLTMSRGVDVLVATPGRLLDHVGARAIQLDQVEIFVLDEADQMLDLGFIVPIRKLVRSLPAQRQNLFFSATMPSEIGKLAGELLHDPVKVAVTPVATTVDKVDQRVIFIDQAQKRALLAELLADETIKRTLVFTRTKHGADRVVRHLDACKIQSAAIHGNKSQSQRERALNAFRNGHTRVLVATDIAARGIDVDGVTHVINFDLPNIPESYVHRIGRTARAGASGQAISFCDHEERPYLKDIEKLIRIQIPATDRRGTVTASASLAGEQAERHRDPRRPHGGQRNHGGNRSDRSDHRERSHGEHHRRRPEAQGEGQSEFRREARPEQNRERHQERRPDSREAPRQDNSRSEHRGERNNRRPENRNEGQRPVAHQESRPEGARHESRSHEKRQPDRRSETGGQAPLHRPGHSSPGSKPKRFGRGGAPRRMGV